MNAGENAEKGEPSYTAGGNVCILVQPLWKAIWRFLEKLEIPFDPVIPLLGIYPKKTRSQIQKDIYTPMFITALFTIAKIWKQPKSLSADEWIKKMWYICTMEYYSARKRKNPTICNNMDRARGYYAQ